MFESRWYLCERDWKNSSSITCQLFNSMKEADEYHRQNTRGTQSTLYDFPFFIPPILDKPMLYLNLRRSFYRIYLK